MNCPSCGVAVEDGADLCLGCGEPMGDSPAAKVARGDGLIRPPTPGFAPPPAKPAVAKPIGARPATPAGATPAAAKPATRKWPTEEAEPRRCPSCGGKSLAVRCPGCGTRLRPDDD